ncbi:MAG: hypothetical protein KBT08_02585 [Bacteroidales bacterium]|nr:hypothetical protein [Candidatus Cryptobacteroides onthequi]
MRLSSALSIIASLLVLAACEPKEPESYHLGTWTYDNAQVRYNGVSYTTTASSLIINSKPFPLPSVIMLSQGNSLRVDGLRGTYTYKDKAGTLDYNGMSQPYTIPYGILFLEDKVNDVSSIIINGKYVSGSGDVTIKSSFYKD